MTDLSPAFFPLNASQRDLLERYALAVSQAPSFLSLTSDRTVKSFWNRHIQDALMLASHLPPEWSQKPLKVLDIGSGNGIPGIPLALVFTHWSVFLLDSNNKKCGFLDTFCKLNYIKNIAVLVGRAEKLAHEPWRGSFDLAIARALDKLPIALELSASFLKLGGALIVPHGTSYKDQLKKSESAIDLLGIKLVKTSSYSLGTTPFLLLHFEKYKETPTRYPRPTSMLVKRPL